MLRIFTNIEQVLQQKAAQWKPVSHSKQCNLLLHSVLFNKTTVLQCCGPYWNNTALSKDSTALSSIAGSFQCRREEPSLCLLVCGLFFFIFFLFQLLRLQLGLGMGRGGGEENLVNSWGPSLFIAGLGEMWLTEWCTEAVPVNDFTILHHYPHH